jgi:hypothetical protein
MPLNAVPDVDKGKADEGGQQLNDQTVAIFSNGLVNVPVGENVRIIITRTVQSHKQCHNFKVFKIDP